MPRKQQRGAGFLDFMNSDPKKKIETNTKKIEELEKDSDTKCDAIKKANDEKIKSLTDENAKLQAQVDAKANEKPSESIASRFSNLFSFGKSASEAKASEAKASETKASETKPDDVKLKEQFKPGVDVPVKPVMEEPVKPVGGRHFGGRKSKKQNRKSVVASKSKRRKSNKK
jgi:predicted nuclease with TOPRIM domain